MEYIAASQSTRIWNISSRCVQILCTEERIPGVFKYGKTWAIPKCGKNQWMGEELLITNARRKMFKCKRCGLCCKSVSLSPLYAELNRGDGICKYFDNNSLLCTIYDHRPLVCNVDAMYETYLAYKMSKNEFYKLNYAGCRALEQAQIKK